MSRSGNYPTILPDGSEIARLRALPTGVRPTFEEIGARYGVSRQAAHKAFKKWLADQAELADSIEVEIPA